MKQTVKKSLIGMMVLCGALSLTASTIWAKNYSGKKLIHDVDLQVQKMSADKVGTAGPNDRVRITVAVIATTKSMSRVCTGPFKVKVSKDQGGTWKFLAHGGVSNICVGGPSAGAVQTLTFTDTVPSNLRGAQKYRAEVDYDGRVAETNERNNIGGTRYIPGH